MKRIINLIITLSAIILLSNCAHIASKLIPFQPLPAPSGEFSIGTLVYHWRDSTRMEWFSENDEDDVRELMVQLWYPGKPNDKALTAPYMDNLEARIPEFAKQIGIPAFMFKHFTKVTTHSFFNLEPIDDQLPVVVFSHGLGGMRTQNTVYMQALASQGYLVAAMDHPYDANITIYPDEHSVLYASNLPENVTDSMAAVIRHKQLNTRSADVSFVIDQLEKMNSGETQSKFFQKLLLDKIGVFGHSFGGATSIHSAYHDERISACLTLDPWYVPVQDEIISTGLTTPFLHIGQPKWDKPLNYEKRREFFQNSGSDALLITMNETKHFDYMDMPLFTTATQKFRLTGEITQNRLYSILADLHIEFFNSYVRELTPFKPEYFQKKYPDLIINSKAQDYSQVTQ